MQPYGENNHVGSRLKRCSAMQTIYRTEQPHYENINYFTWRDGNNTTKIILIEECIYLVKL